MFCIESLHRNGQNIYWIDVPSTQSDTPIILLTHGFPDNGFGWEKQIDFFQENFKDQFYLIAPFMHGSLNKEVASTKRIHTDELLKDVSAVLNQIDPKSSRPVYLIGHDLGAFLSIAVHDLMPTRIKGIVHLNGMGLQQYYHRKFSLRQWLKSYYVILVQFSLVRFVIKRIFPKQFLNLIYKLSRVDQHDPLFQNDQGLFTNLTQYKMLFKRIFYYMGMKITKIKVPTLFIWGHQDVFLNHPTISEVEQFYENAEIRIIEGGHWVHSSSTKHVNTLLHKTFTRWEKPELNDLTIKNLSKAISP
jgi:pimeloyl-ACP methyl ester carboxylesterase